jgi:4-diphosphocytidyl-2-C-methyl-D-erythritol kinase
MGGIGEIIEEGPVLAGIHIVLVNPGKPLATPQVFAGYSKHFSLPARHPGAFASHQACTEFLHKNRNDLQEPAVKLMPEIGIIIAAINSQKDCMLARMSGSGATCFGLFSNAQSAQKAAEALSELWPSGWVKQTMIR